MHLKPSHSWDFFRAIMHGEVYSLKGLQNIPFGKKSFQGGPKYEEKMNKKNIFFLSKKQKVDIPPPTPPPWSLYL